MADKCERKYPVEPNQAMKSQERLQRAKADLNEMKKQPDWKARLEAAECYTSWPKTGAD